MHQLRGGGQKSDSSSMCHVIYECPLGVRGWCMSAAHEDCRNQGARGQIPSISPGLQAKRRPFKGLELPHPPDFQTFLRPFSWLSSISRELLRCPTHHISTMVISHKLSSRELAHSTSSARHSKFRTHFRSEVLCNLKFNMITEFTDNDQVWHMITSWDHHRVIYADFLQWHCFDFRVLDHIILKL